MDGGHLLGRLILDPNKFILVYPSPLQQNGNISALLKCKCIFVIILEAPVDDSKHNRNK
jgi:hypothetical protein